MREGDYGRPEILPAALTGDSVSCWSPEARSAGFCPSTRPSSARPRPRKCSALSAIARSTPTAPPCRSLPNVGAEQALRTSKVPFTVLRSGCDTENHTGSWPGTWPVGQFWTPPPEARSPRHPRRLCCAASTALIIDDSGNAVHEFGYLPSHSTILSPPSPRSPGPGSSTPTCRREVCDRTAGGRTGRGSGRLPHHRGHRHRQQRAGHRRRRTHRLLGRPSPDRRRPRRAGHGPAPSVRQHRPSISPASLTDRICTAPAPSGVVPGRSRNARRRLRWYRW